MKSSSAQLEANRRYRAKHPEKVKHARYKFQTKIFINKYANDKDIAEIYKWISERKKDI